MKSATAAESAEPNSSRAITGFSFGVQGCEFHRLDGWVRIAWHGRRYGTAFSAVAPNERPASCRRSARPDCRRTAELCNEHSEAFGKRRRGDSVFGSQALPDC
jgi:hypothetical protein